MSAPLNDGGPAFPFISDHTYPTTINDGMTLRDYFAGQALAGILSAREYTPFRDRMGITEIRFHAMVAYDQADAMLAARKKGNK
jgi:hypothetical protein